MSNLRQLVTLFFFSLICSALLSTQALGQGSRTGSAVLAPQGVDSTKLTTARDLESQYRTGKLSDAEKKQYQMLQRKAEGDQKMAAMKKPTGFADATASAQSCKCTATCQTIVWASNAGSYEWTAVGTVSGPSACADAAVATCGNAVASYLMGWNCQ